MPARSKAPQVIKKRCRKTAAVAFGISQVPAMPRLDPMQCDGILGTMMIMYTLKEALKNENTDPYGEG
jgi:hypothetical protein